MINCIKILFNDLTDYQKVFRELHSKDREICDKDFIDIKDKEIKEYMENKYKLQAKQIRTNKRLLENVIKTARRITSVGIRDLADILEISKSTVSIYEKK